MVVYYILCRCHAFVPLPLTVTEAWRSVIADYSSASAIRLLRGFCCQYSGLAQRSASQLVRPPRNFQPIGQPCPLCGTSQTSRDVRFVALLRPPAMSAFPPLLE